MMIQQAFENLNAAKSAAATARQTALENNTIWLDGVSEAEFAASKTAATTGYKTIAEYRSYCKSLRKAAEQAENDALDAHDEFMNALRELPEGSEERRSWARRAQEL